MIKTENKLRQTKQEISTQQIHEIDTKRLKQTILEYLTNLEKIADFEIWQDNRNVIITNNYLSIRVNKQPVLYYGSIGQIPSYHSTINFNQKKFSHLPALSFLGEDVDGIFDQIINYIENNFEEIVDYRYNLI